jgi:hypothetical protein
MARPTIHESWKTQKSSGGRRTAVSKRTWIESTRSVRNGGEDELQMLWDADPKIPKTEKSKIISKISPGQNLRAFFF